MNAEVRTTERNSMRATSQRGAATLIFFVFLESAIGAPLLFAAPYEEVGNVATLPPARWMQ